MSPHLYIESIQRLSKAIKDNEAFPIEWQTEDAWFKLITPNEIEIFPKRGLKYINVNITATKKNKFL